MRPEPLTAEAGRGYLTEALQLTLNYTFGPLKLHRLEANIQPGNERSARARA
jgi:ribosomal-protein-alanine N-acetyltransferase